ncbi:Hypothetical protein LUCI_3677 [Lucifera butyrica]|uniref:Uncharacterized protein n=1 Tax=Lucifera butyrica TaxID=1351585 RepID=A0A498RBQ9_9FIRM|nr:hypothetical protein [Lucifera butyrica]VBB08333.1 Hypothetical protein LUCI_3604 [Lucifera butyrica]VBB08405.1 Hypothetical protein LUCI_3677 [Lucifera butyrica]
MSDLLFEDINEYLEANRKNTPDQRLRGILQLFIRNTTGQNYPNSVFRMDMLLMALSKDFYQFQRNMRGYTPEMFLEQLYLTFID